MTENEPTLIREPGAESAQLERALFELKRVVVGQEHVLERVLVCLLAGGHLLLEGVPGLAKTLTVKTLAEVFGGTFHRIQFTPDLVPSDLVGTRIYRPGEGEFATELGRSSATSSSQTRSTVHPPRSSRRFSRSCRSGR